MQRRQLEVAVLIAVWLGIFALLLTGLGRETLKHVAGYAVMLLILTVLIGERWPRKPKPLEQFLAESPLVAFSLYTHLQSEETRRLGREILATLDEAIPSGKSSRPKADHTLINRVYGQFWLWVLAAYEIVRTMDQANGCFSQPVAKSVHDFKDHIADLRMPFAEQEYAGDSRNPIPIEAEASIAGINTGTRDTLFEVSGTEFSTRQLVGRFDGLIRNIKPEDIIHRHGWRPPAA